MNWHPPITQEWLDYERRRSWRLALRFAVGFMAIALSVPAGIAIALALESAW